MNRWLWGLIGAGTLLRLLLAARTRGLAADMHSLDVVREALAAHGLYVYRYVDAGVNVVRWHWPYPPAFFPWISLSGVLAGGGEQAFRALIRMPMIAGDAALAWLVQDYLRARGAGERARRVAVAAVAFGPVFVVISGYHGQIDSLAILPAVAALVVWERHAGDRRALWAGLLLGLGGALKTVPVLMVLALAPSARSWREIALLVSAAAGVVLLSLAPFLIAAPSATISPLRHYHGLPGVGGISLAVQPNLSRIWLMGSGAHVSGLNAISVRLLAHGSLINWSIVGGVAALLARYRPPPVIGAVLMWLALFAFEPAFSFQYLIWGLPFFLMAGYVRATLLLQLAVLVPMFLFYLGPWHTQSVSYVYVPIMLTVWLGLLAALAAVARGALRNVARSP